MAGAAEVSIHQQKRPYAVIIGLLLLGLWLRAHHITALLVFSDEWLHIKRAAVIYDFQQHPAVESNGKFLFYFLLGIFDLKQSSTALFLGRTAVALTSLLTGTVVFRLAFRLWDWRAGLAALAFYMLIPYAVFFERMALADPLAGLLAAVLAWRCLRLAARPTQRRAVWVGIFLALTPAAKLSLVFVTGLPVIALMLFAPYMGWRDGLRRYWRLGLTAALVVIGFWLVILVPAMLDSALSGRQYAIFPTWLVDTESLTLLEKISDSWEKMTLLASLPLTLVLLLLIPLVAAQQPRTAGFLLAWLGLVWFAAFFVVGSNSFQSRYLMSGVPAIAVFFGIGSLMAAEKLPQLGHWIVIFGLGIWGLFFALPFAHTAATDPTDLRLPHLDRQNYFEGYYNAYALLDAVKYLRDHGEDHAVLGTRWCLPDLYGIKDAVPYVCDKHTDLEHLQDSVGGRTIADWLADGIPVYFVTDVELTTPNAELIASYPKPFGEITIYVWRVTPIPPAPP